MTDLFTLLFIPAALVVFAISAYFALNRTR